MRRSSQVVAVLGMLALLIVGAGIPPASASGLRWVEGRAVIRDCPQCPEMLVVPAGRYLMGTPRGVPIETEVPAELEPVEIEIARPFALGRFEVTYEEFAAFAAATRFGVKGGCRSWDARGERFRDDAALDWKRPNASRAPRLRDPVTCVSWDDAHAYAAWLAAATRRAYRLPSEAEWEYAARAGTTTLRPWGDSPDDACAWANTYDETSAATYVLGWPRHRCRDGLPDLAPVGSLRPNAYGFFDMIGNVWEWLEDCSTLTYVGRPRDARAWVWQGGCTRRIQRGGGWSTGPDRSRSGFHGDGAADDRADFAGLRVARDLTDEEVAAFRAGPREVARRGAIGAGTHRAAHVPAEAATPAAQSDRRVDGAPPQGFRLIPAGRFVMGSSADAYEHDVASGETPPLTVTIRAPFVLATYEVTVGEFRRFVAATGAGPPPGCRVLVDGAWQWSDAADWQRPRVGTVGDDEPVTCVSAADAEAYARWLGTRDGATYRLPSESEWEYAARAGTTTPRPWGTVRDSHEGVSISLACENANVYDIAAARSQPLRSPNARCRDDFPQAAPVGRFAPNAFGLHDMIGNAREWTADCFTSSYKGRPADERPWRWSGGCERRPVRGGSWASRPFESRSASRAGELATLRQSDVGFRLVREAGSPDGR